MAEDKNAPVSARPRPLPVDDPRSRAAQNERALVLGGGGSAGKAWEIGVIAGLFDAGLDVTEADLIIGTSAGATAAAQITTTTPPELLAAILTAALPRRHPDESGGARPAAAAVAEHMARTDRLIAAAADPADMRRRM